MSSARSLRPAQPPTPSPSQGHHRRGMIASLAAPGKRSGSAAPPRPAQSRSDVMTTIVRCVISPGLGIARVGNSPAEYYIGPEAPGQLPQAPGGFKDSAGRIKRQAARFRVYGLDKSGKVVAEVTPDIGEIRWRVHLANRKAAWYQFLNAMDLGAKYAKTAGRRNSALTGSKRQGLVIDPGPRSITGPKTVGKKYHFDTGKFMGEPVL